MYVFRLVRRPNTEQRFVSLHAGWHNKVFCFIFGCNNLTVNYTYIVFTAKESHAPAQPPAGWCHGAENVGPEASVSAGLAKALWCRPLVYRHTPWMRKAVLFSCSAKLCVNMTLLIQGAPPPLLLSFMRANSLSHTTSSLSPLLCLYRSARPLSLLLVPQTQHKQTRLICI